MDRSDSDSDCVAEQPPLTIEEAKRLKESGKKEFGYRIKTQKGGDFDRKFNLEEILGLQEKVKNTISTL